MEFLGFMVDGETIRPTPKNVYMVQKFPPPTTMKKVRTFLGMANFNRKFIKNFSEIARPLTYMTSPKMKFDWGPAQHTAFERGKEGISKAQSLCLADWGKEEFNIETDSSDTSVGAVLFQLSNNKDQMPLAYYSKNPPHTEKRWSATDKEMYGIICEARNGHHNALALWYFISIISRSNICGNKRIPVARWLDLRLQDKVYSW